MMTTTSPLPMMISTIPSWIKYIFVPIVPSLMIVSPEPFWSTLSPQWNPTWLEHLILQLCHHLGDESRVGVHKERHWSHQSSAVVVDHVFPQPVGELAEDGLLVKELALVAVLKVLSDPVPCVWRQLSVGHVLLNLFRLLSRKKIGEQSL